MDEKEFVLELNYWNNLKELDFGRLEDEPFKQEVKDNIELYFNNVYPAHSPEDVITYDELWEMYDDALRHYGMDFLINDAWESVKWIKFKQENSDWLEVNFPHCQNYLGLSATGHYYPISDANARLFFKEQISEQKSILKTNNTKKR